jgi:hypothetical protein
MKDERVEDDDNEPIQIQVKTGRKRARAGELSEMTWRCPKAQSPESCNQRQSYVSMLFLFLTWMNSNGANCMGRKCWAVEM